MNRKENCALFCDCDNSLLRASVMEISNFYCFNHTISKQLWNFSWAIFVVGEIVVQGQKNCRTVFPADYMPGTSACNSDVVVCKRASAKGQLILKCLIGVFNFLKKTNKNKSHSSKIEFICPFLGGNIGMKNNFDFVWPLAGNSERAHGIWK